MKTSKFAKTNVTRVSGQWILTSKEIRGTFFLSFKKVEIGPTIDETDAHVIPTPHFELPPGAPPSSFFSYMTVS